MAQRKIYRWLGYTAWALGGVGLLVLLAGATRRQQAQRCSGVMVNIAAIGGKVFVDEAEVKQVIGHLSGGLIVGQPISRFNLRAMEHALRQDVWIEDAQLFLDNDAVLHAEIKERYPVARVFDMSGASWYIDTSGKRLPLSHTDRADVPVFTGMMIATRNNQQAWQQAVKEVVSIARAIDADAFWNAQAAQIDLLGAGRYRMYPTIGNHVIELGNASDMPDKLQRLKTFYQQVFGREAFVKYDRLNVAYKGQLVASVGSDTVNSHVDGARAIQVINQIAQQNKREINAAAIESVNPSAGRIMPDADVPAPPPKASAPAARPPTVAQPPPDTGARKPKAVMPTKISTN